MALLKELQIPVQPILNLLHEQKSLIEQGLKEMTEGKLHDYDYAIKKAEEWLLEK